LNILLNLFIKKNIYL